MRLTEMSGSSLFQNIFFMTQIHWIQSPGCNLSIVTPQNYCNEQGFQRICSFGAYIEVFLPKQAEEVLMWLDILQCCVKLREAAKAEIGCKRSQLRLGFKTSSTGANSVCTLSGKAVTMSHEGGSTPCHYLFGVRGVGQFVVLTFWGKVGGSEHFCH